METLLLLAALWLLYGLAVALQRVLAGRRPRRPAPPAPRRPPARPPSRRPVAVATPEARRPPEAPPQRREAAAARPAAQTPWARRLKRPETLREAIVVAEILRRPGSRIGRGPR